MTETAKTFVNAITNNSNLLIRVIVNLLSEFKFEIIEAKVQF